MDTYLQYFRRARMKYGITPTDEAQLYDHTLSWSSPSHKSSILDLTGFSPLVKSLEERFDEKGSNPKNIFHPPITNRQFARRITNLYDVKEIEETAQLIIPQIERNLYGCHLHLFETYFYETCATEEEPSGSWLWHIDNHPKEVFKVMIYLNDVTEKNGPFEYLGHSSDQRGIKYPTSRVSHKEWIQQGGKRFSSEEVAHYKKHGFGPCRVTGKAGTTLIFDNNIVHRGSIPKEGSRKALVFMLKPSIKQFTRYFSKRHTGTWGDVQIFMDPAFVGVKKENAEAPLTNLFRRAAGFFRKAG